MSIYRDSLAGLKSQVATKRAVVASREHDLSPVLRALLPARLRDALVDLQPRAFASGDTMEALTDIEAALDAILALYDEAVDLAPKLRECPDEVENPAPPGMSPPWLMEEPSLVAFREAMRERVLRITTDTYLARFGDFAYIARFRIGSAPYAVVAKAHVLPDDAQVARYTLILRTSVPESLPSLVLSPQGLLHEVGAALHLVREIVLGDPAIDDNFWITGSAATAAILTADVRAALGRLEGRGLALGLGNGMATLSWSGPWHGAAREAFPDAALDVLTGIRLAIETG